MLKTFETLINQFNTERRCGFGWKFYATGRQDYSNLINTAADCDDIIFILETWSDSGTVNRANGERLGVVTLDCFIGFQSSLDETFYNETTDGEPCAGNRYESYIEPLEKCLRDGLLNHVCIDNDWFQLSSQTKNLRLNYLDQNLDGFKLRLIYSS